MPTPAAGPLPALFCGGGPKSEAGILGDLFTRGAGTAGWCHFGAVRVRRRVKRRKRMLPIGILTG